MFRFIVTSAAVCLVVAFTTAQTPLTPSGLREHPQIAYSATKPRDPVAALNAQLEAGTLTLQHNERNGYLEAVLAALEVPVDSQLLVFSKTSFQAPRINPKNPRALYHNDNIAVGWVRGGEVLEFAAQDPTQGTIFYTLDQSTDTPPRFVRNTATCVQCHTGDATLNVPGLFAMSVYPDATGNAQYALLESTDHRTPFEMRWGGWYVTGTHKGHHLGNAVATNPSDVTTMATPETSHLASLAGRFEISAYPQQTSDLVSLLVMEHQMRMLNLITRIGWEARVGSAAAGRSIDRAVNELVDYLLFVDETELAGPIAGSSSFAKTFAAHGRRDSERRSLRDLDLQTHLFRYPCSYLIDSAPFAALPDDVRQRIYARMFEILSGRAADPRYARLGDDRRRAVLDILAETKPDLPSYFRESTPDYP